jgi:hypothetical protein
MTRLKRLLTDDVTSAPPPTPHPRSRTADQPVPAQQDHPGRAPSPDPDTRDFQGTPSSRSPCSRHVMPMNLGGVLPRTREPVTKRCAVRS